MGGGDVNELEISPGQGGKNTYIGWPRAEQTPEVESDADTAFELGRVAGYDEAMREMRRVRGGEPSDAQVLAALKAWGEHRHLNIPATIMTSMRAALRAARGVL